jgi:hypothetical protein
MDGVSAVDGLSTPSSEGATDPQLAVAEYGTGWVTSARTNSDGLFATALGDNGALAGPAAQVNTIPSAAPPYQVPVIDGYHADFIAWQQESGTTPGGVISLRWAGDGVTLGPEQVLSSPLQGPTDAADGLAAAGDIGNDAAVAWLQGLPGATQLMVDQLYQPPSGFSPVKAFAYSTTPQPFVAWTRPSGWGPMTYSLNVDGIPVGQLGSTSATIPGPLSDGPHSWLVTATNPAGQQNRSRVATVFVDTVAPTASLALPKRKALGDVVRALLRYADLPPAGLPATDASGVATVVVRWGDGTSTRLVLGRHVLTHVYKRARRYQIILIVTDKAGNRTKVVKVLRIIKRKPKAAAKSRGHT